MVRIPSEYQEVEWIGTDGTGAYIDTGIQTSEDLKFTVDFQARRASAKYIMGRYNNDNTSFYLYFGSGQVFQTAFGTKWTNTNLASDSNRHKFVYEFENGYLRVKNNDDVIVSKQADFSTPQNIYVVGSVNSSRTASKTYSVTMSKNGTLIQNLIPCYRKSDNEPGMYDTVSKTFFTNASTGTFLVGNDVNYSNTNLLEVRRRILLNTPHIESMSGNPAIFSTDMAANLKECKIHFTPVQAGEGTPSPENVRPISGWDGVTINFLGKRLTPEDNPNNPHENYTSNSSRKVVYDTEEEAFTSSESGVGVIYTNHYKTGSGINGRLFVAPFATTITLSFDYKHYGKSTVGNRWPIRITGAISTNIIAPDEPTEWVHFEQTVNIKQGSTILICFYSGVFWKNLQVISGDSIANDIPYTNTSINIPFPQTIFGGYVDLIKGEVVEEWIKKTLVGGEIYNTGKAYRGTDCTNAYVNISPKAYGNHATSRAISDSMDKVNTSIWASADSYPNAFTINNGIQLHICLPNSLTGIESSDTDAQCGNKFKAFVQNNNINFAYLLATPNVYSLTPQTIKALKGLNNLYSDANGNIEVKFWKH